MHKLMEVERIIAKAPRALILDMSDVLHMDSTGLHVLLRIHKECRNQRVRLILAGVHAQPLVVLEQADQMEVFGRQNLAGDLRDALELLRAA